MRDSILFWNAVALEANRVSHTDPLRKEQTGPTLSSRALAIVHLAMYDAYAGIEGNAAAFPRYLAVPAPGGGSHADAVAGAAFTTLAGLFKAQRDFFEAQLSGFDARPTNPSYQFGLDVGSAMLADRENDPDARDAGYVPSPTRGRHRVDPENPGQGFHAPFYGAQSYCFAVSKRWGLKPPPFDNAEYRRALEEVRADGIKPELMATLPQPLFAGRRTAEETLIGIWWGYDGAIGLGTPPRFYNQIVRAVAMKQNNDEGQNARLFAFVNAAMGDAGVLAWEQKYCHDLWRPVVGIREHDSSFGPSASGATAASALSNLVDPGWLPLGAPNTNSSNKNFTPPFPAYPSGHATFGAAALHITRLFYGKGFAANGTTVISGGKKIIKNGNLVGDDLTDDLGFVSEEHDGRNRDNQGAARPRHVRSFPAVPSTPAESAGLGRMILENGRSRVYLGVHWVFDAFRLKNGKPDFTNIGVDFGGVPLGLKIAEDIFKTGDGKAPKKSTVAPPVATPAASKVGMPTAPLQPATVAGCADAGKRATPADAEQQMVQDVFLEGTSPR